MIFWDDGEAFLTFRVYGRSMSDSYSIGEDPVPDRLAQKGLAGYDTHRAYDVVKTMFGNEPTPSTDNFLSPVEQFDNGTYAGDEPIGMFDQDFHDILDAYDSSTEPTTFGYELANTFVEADDYETARDALSEFESWAERSLNRMMGDTGIVLEGLRLDSEEYESAITYHSLRRLVQRKKEFEQGDGELFEPQEDVRDIDLAAE